MKKVIRLIFSVAFIFSILLQNAVFAVNDAKADKTITRAEFCLKVSDLLKSKGIKTMEKQAEAFLDVSEEDSHFDEIMWLKQLNIISGDGNGNFRPDDNITFQEALVLAGKVIGANQYIKENNEKYPYGYIKFALDKGLSDEVNTAYVNEVTEDEAKIIVNNLGKQIKIYDIMEPLGCDSYDGNVYIDYYPKNWQGFESAPLVNPDAYFKILPAKLMYSYDNKEWHTAYEDIDGKRTYYGLPENLEGSRYAWEYSAFVSAPYDTEENYYSYDYKTWYEGEPPETEYKNSEVTEGEFIFGIDKEDIIYLEEDGLYFAKYPYEREDYTSKRYNTVLTENKMNMLWVSKDLKEWIGIIIPEGVNFHTGVALERRAQAYIIDCAVDFTEEENAYLDNEERTAEELGLEYDRPRRKTEKYILRFSDVNKLFE